MLIKDYKPGKIICAHNKMDSKYCYTLSSHYGKIDPRMKGALSPLVMLKKGVFSGKYLNDCKSEFPKEWFAHAKLSINEKNNTKNLFKVESRLPLSKWRTNGWIYGDDNRGWFQWYCRYYIGRRDNQLIKKGNKLIPLDELQIKRWLAFKRHSAQLSINAKKENRIGDKTFRPVQRQALLQWAYDPFPELKN